MAEYLRKFSVVNKLIALENELQQYKPFRPCEATMYHRICDVEVEIGKMDAEDVAPVRHGRWVKVGYACGETEWQCSSCKETEWRISSDRLKYCPFCGSKMDLEV